MRITRSNLQGQASYNDFCREREEKKEEEKKSSKNRIINQKYFFTPKFTHLSNEINPDISEIVF